MNTKIYLFLLLAVWVEGCVQQSSNIQTVGDNGTAVMSGKYLATLNMQPGEKIYYIDCSFCNSYTYIGNEITIFTNTHNVTKIEYQYNEDGHLIGAYIIYRN